MEFNVTLQGWTVGSLIGCFAILIFKSIYKEISYRKIKLYNTAIESIYKKVEEYISCAQSFKDSVILLNHDVLRMRNVSVLDTEFTYPLCELRKKSDMLKMFFPAEYRHSIENIYESANRFNFNLRMLLQEYNQISDNEKRVDGYEKISRNFVKNFDSVLSQFIELCYNRFFGVSKP